MPKKRKNEINAKWAKKKKKKVGLVARTLERNYNEIQKLKHAPERKFIGDSRGQSEAGDVDYQGESSTGAAVMLNLVSGLAQGTKHDQRIGRQVQLSRLTIKVIFAPPSGLLAESANRCTAVLVLDKCPGGSGGLPAVQELYNMDPPNTSLQNAFYDMKTVTNAGLESNRFKVLQRKTIWVGDQPNCMPEGYLTMSTNSPYKFDYGDEATASAHALNQTLRLFLYSDSTTAPHPGWVVRAKFSYTDC